MYKLIIGNTRITVNDDEITHAQAINTARQAILNATARNKQLSIIELCLSEEGIDVQTTERIGSTRAHKNIRQSMLDAIMQAASEKLSPADGTGSSDFWYDNDTGQEWRGDEVVTIRTSILNKLTEWCKDV